MKDQYMHFIELKTQLRLTSEGSVMIKTLAYVFSSVPELPPGQYEATSCSGDAAYAARLFVGCRDSDTYCADTTLHMIDHTKGKVVLQALGSLAKKTKGGIK